MEENVNFYAFCQLPALSVAVCRIPRAVKPLICACLLFSSISRKYRICKIVLWPSGSWTNGPRITWVVGLNPVSSPLQIHTYMLPGGCNWHCWLRDSLAFSPGRTDCHSKITCTPKAQNVMAANNFWFYGHFILGYFQCDSR